MCHNSMRKIIKKEEDLKWATLETSGVKTEVLVYINDYQGKTLGRSKQEHYDFSIESDNSLVNLVFKCLQNRLAIMEIVLLKSFFNKYWTMDNLRGLKNMPETYVLTDKRKFSYRFIYGK